MDEKLKEEITELLRGFQVQDSIELGDSRGRVKVYVDFAKKEEAKARINNAIELLKEKKAEALE